MRCPGCRHENPDAAKFCQECGTRLVPGCARCGTELPAAAKFCHECGADVRAGTAASDSASAHEAAAAAISGDPAAAPREFGGGRYRVQRFLGEGAKKRVYLARDTRLARDVAVAVMRTEGLGPSDLERVQREAEALGRLGDHPHIVTVHDALDESGQVQLVTEFLTGGDLETRLSAAPDRRLPWADVRELGLQIARALAHAHARDIVHRDVKPQNIWFAADGQAKLGDFGLAVALDRSRVSMDGALIGTATYMPPEQALGRGADARSDLYALGVVLYEALTGRVPFSGDDVVAVISQHINTPPVAPRWHDPQIPPVFEELVLALLAKDPDRRPQSAAELVARLDALGADAAQAPAFASANPLDRLSGGVFVGRETELETLRRALDEAVSGRGGMKLLVGEPGIGKTRTAEELGTYARMRGARVFWGRCYEGEGAPAYWPWLQIGRTYAEATDPETLRSRLGPGAADIGEIVPELRAALPDLPRPPVLPAEQTRFRLFDAVASFLRNASRDEPTVVVLDDLHWADGPSLLLLQFVARAIAGTRVLLLGTYRDIELGRQHPLQNTLAELARDGLAERIVLRGLDRTGVGRYIEQTAHLEPPESLVDAVYRETEGNPFFVSEVVRLLEAEGRLRDAASSASWSVDVPQGVRQVVGRRLSALSERCNATLAAAAVIGREFDLELLERTSVGTREALLADLDEALAQRLVEARERVGTYRFSHALVQQTLFEELSTPQRVRMHQRVGETLESLHRDASGPHLASLAHHFFQAVQSSGVERAVHYCRRAGDWAKTSVAYEEAAAHYRRAAEALELQDTPDPRELCELLVLQAEAGAATGGAAFSPEACVRAANLARQIGDADLQARAALSYTGFVVVEMGRVDATRVGLLEQALEAIGPAPSELRVQLLTGLANEYFFGARLETVPGLYAEAVRVAREVGDPARLAAALLWQVGLRMERDIDGLATAEEALSLVRPLGNPRALIDALQWKAAFLLRAGRTAEVRACLDEKAALVEQLRIPLDRYYAVAHEAMWALLTGDLERARELGNRTLSVGQSLIGPNAIQWFAAHNGVRMRFAGEDGSVQVKLIRKLVADYPQVPIYRAALAYRLALGGEHDEARQYLDELHAHGSYGVPIDPNFSVTFCWIAGAAISCRARDHAQAVYDILYPSRDHHCVLGPGVAYYGTNHYYLGRLAHVLRHYEAAEIHFRAAVEAEARAGARPWLAETHLEYARMLHERDAAGDAARALGQLDAALELGRDIGMPWHVEHALALRLELQGVGAEPSGKSIVAVAHAVDRRRPDLARHAAPDGTVTLMFSDMEGFTSMTERLGDRAALELVQAHNRIVREQTLAHGGHEVELRGDGFLLAFSSARQALLCAIALQRAMADRNAGHPDEPIRVRIGLHTGEAIRDADRFFGKSVIEAFRIADIAAGGEIVVSSLVKQLTRSSGDLRFGAARDVELKGISGVQTVHPVQWS